jgi:type I restriction enzyme, S subunit
MSEWIDATVSDVTKYQKAGGTPVATNPDYYGGDIPFVVIEDITKSSRFLEKTENTLSCKGLLNSAAWLIQEPHILYSMYATVGKPIINKISCATNQAIIALKENELIEQKFLYYQLLFIRPSVHKFTAQTTQSNLNAGVVRRLPITYPKNKAAQRKIVKILGTIDQAIAHTEALIQKYQQIKAGLMHDLFTRGITSDGQLRPPREKAPELYRETAIGWIPKEWAAKKLENILAESGGYLQTGPFGSQLHAHEYTFEGVPVVMPQDINDGKISIAEITRIPEKRAEVLHRHRLKVGDIIIARRGELSRASAITDLEKSWICGTGCFLLRLGGSNLDSRFFSLAYRHDLVQRQVGGLAVGSTMPSLNNSVMSALYFPHINIDEQNRISARIEIVEQEIETLNRQRQKLAKQKSGLMHDLLTGKVPVTISES